MPKCKSKVNFHFSKYFIHIQCCKAQWSVAMLPEGIYRCETMPVQNLFRYISFKWVRILETNIVILRIPRASLVPFITFRGPLFPKPVTVDELFLLVFFQQTRSRVLSFGRMTFIVINLKTCTKTHSGHFSYTNCRIASALFWKSQTL